MQTTLNSSVKLWISYTNIPDLFPKSSAVKNFKSKDSCGSLVQNPFKGVHLSCETQNLCSNWLRKGILVSWAGCWPKHTLFRLKSHLHWHLPTCCHTWLLSSSSGIPRAATALLSANPSLGAACSVWDFQQKHHNIHLWSLNPSMALNSTLPPDLPGGHCRLIGHGTSLITESFSS